MHRPGSGGGHAHSELAAELGIADSLENLAGLASGTGRFERAPVLGGIAEALREELSAPMTAPERERHERFLASARVHIDPATWNEQWAKGRTIAQDLERVVAYALEQG